MYFIQGSSLILQYVSWPEKTKVIEPQHLCGNNSKYNLAVFFFFNRKLIFPLKTDTFPSSAPGHLFTVFPINSNRTFSDCPHILQETIILTPLLANTAKFWVNLFHFLLSVKICVTYLLISFFVFSFAFLLIRWSQWRISQEFIKLSSLFQLSYILGS